MDFWKKKSKKFEKIRKYIPIVLKNNKKKISKKLCIQDRPKRTSGIYLLFFSAQNKPNSMDFWKNFEKIFLTRHQEADFGLNEVQSVIFFEKHNLCSF